MFLIWAVQNPHLSQRFTLLQELLQQPAEIKAVKEMKQSNYSSDQRKLPSTVCWQWNTFPVGSPWTEDVAGQRLVALPVTPSSSPFLSPIPHIWLVLPTTTCLSMFIASQPLWVNVYCQSTTLFRKLKESNPNEPVQPSVSHKVTRIWLSTLHHHLGEFSPLIVLLRTVMDEATRLNVVKMFSIEHWVSLHRCDPICLIAAVTVVGVSSVHPTIWTNHGPSAQDVCSLSAPIIRFKRTQTAVPGFKNDWKVSTGSTGIRHSERSQKYKYYAAPVTGNITMCSGAFVCYFVKFCPTITTKLLCMIPGGEDSN